MIQNNSRPLNFLGLPPEYSSFEKSKVVILPISHQSANVPEEIILESRNLELFDEELSKETYKIGIHTLDEIIDVSMEELYTISHKILQAGKYLVTLSGEHSVISPLVKAHLEKWPSMAVLHIDAHADMPDCYQGSKLCPVVRVGVRNIPSEEVQVLPKLRSKIFHLKDIERDSEWFVKVVDELPEHVYFTVDVYGMDSSSITATRTTEQGGLTWQDMMQLTRELTHRRNVVGLNIVPICPQTGQKVALYLCAKLLYKMLGFVFNK